MKEKISPQEYSQILDGMELHDIVLTSSKIEYSGKVLPVDSLSVNITNNSKLKILTENAIHVIDTFKLRVLEEDQETQFVEIQVSFRLAFSCKVTVSKEFFDIYKQFSLKLNTWPYFREFVQNMTARMNIPPLTLPLFKSGPSEATD